MALTPEGTPYVESTDLVANYPAASLSLANRVDLVGVLPFANAAARTAAISSPTDGQFTYLQDTNSTEFYNGSAYEALGGKILQVVRATDATNRTTTSTSYVDATGMSVTITPKKLDSSVLVFAIFNGGLSNTDNTLGLSIADSSNNGLSGAENCNAGSLSRLIQNPFFLVGRVAPNTVSAVTYKLRFKVNSGTGTLYNSEQTGQMYAIEVSA